MHRFPRSLATLTGLTAIYATAAFAQVGPKLSVGPGTVATIASGTNNVLAGNPDTGGTGSVPRFNGVAYFNSPTEGSIVYMSDAGKSRVFKLVVNTGQVTAYAGTGTPGNTGDGGPATAAQLNEPAGLAVNSSGDLFIADTTANVVRYVTSSGIIARYVGDGTTGTPSYAGEGGPSLAVKLSKPVGLAFDAANNLYIADSTQGLILKVAAGSTTTTTVAGNGGGNYGDNVSATSVGLQLPVGVAVGPNGDIYLSETRAQTVRRVSGGNISTLAGQNGSAGFSGDGGPASSSQLNTPYGLAVDAGGAVYIAEAANHTIRKVTTDGGRTITTIAGIPTVSGYVGDGGSSLSANLNSPSFLTVDPATGNLYFVDSGNAAIRSVTAQPSAVSFSGSSAATLTLSNVGDQNLSVNAPTVPANFSITGGTCGAGGAATIAPGQSCTVIVQSSGTGAGALAFTTATPNVGATAYLNVMAGLRFVPVTPCRVVDTRLPDATFGGGALAAAQTKSWDIRNSATVGCSSAPVPSGADVRAYSLNATVVPKGPSLQFLTLYPSFLTTRPVVSTLNSFDGRFKANAAIVPVNGDNSGNTAVSAFVSDASDVVIDINGYYVPASTSGAQAYYPVPPCRVSDTRRANGTFGGPFLSGGGSLTSGQTPDSAKVRTLPVRSSACSIPSSATAYAVNVTALPRAGRLTYLSMWPADQAPPFVSTLNSPTRYGGRKRRHCAGGDVRRKHQCLCHRRRRSCG